MTTSTLPIPYRLAQALIRCESVTPDEGGALDAAAGRAGARAASPAIA